MGRIKEISREPAHRRKGNTVQNICFVYRRKIPRNGVIIDNTGKMRLVSAGRFFMGKGGK